VGLILLPANTSTAHLCILAVRPLAGVQLCQHYEIIVKNIFQAQHPRLAYQVR